MSNDNQVTTMPAAPRRSVLIEMAARYGMEPAAFEATVRATCLPPDKSGRQPTREEFAAFLLVAKEYNLNPFTRQIFGFATKGGGIQPVVSVDGWCHLVNAHPQLDGIEFDDHVTNGRVTAITARMWRKDRQKPVVVTEYLEECARDTEPWRKWPRRMLRHKSLIQCARYAFGFSGIVDPDEAERMGIDVSPMRDVTPRRDEPPPPPPPAARQEPPAPPSAEQPLDGEVVWDLDGERPATAADFISQIPDDGSIPPFLLRTAS